MINLSMAEPENNIRPRICVMGVGGAGGNAINNMINAQLLGCDFVAANTDAQALAMSLAPHKIQLGINLSRGLGAGSKPDMGRAAAEEQITDILSCLEGSDMLFITAGMGGGTGTGAAPVIARAAKESGILTVGVVTRPFHFEGTHRMRQAEAGIAELQQYVDTLIVIPNQNLFRIANERTTFAEAFRLADEVLHSGVRGITDLMVMPGFMNLDFADVKTVMQEMGKAMMGTGEADGDNRAVRAAESAISNPLLDDISMKGARGVLINITGGMDMTLFEVDQAANRIRDEVDPEAQIKVGSTLGENLEGKIRVSVIATGIEAPMEAQKGREAPSNVRTIQSTAAMVRPVVETAKERPLPQQKPVAQQPTIPVETTTHQVNAASSYFTMPQVITPQMLAQQKSAPQVQETVATQQPVETAPVQQPMSLAAKQAEMLLATQAAAAPQVRPVQPTSNMPAKQPSRASMASPVRNAINTPPQQKPVETTTTQDDIRVTQITTHASVATTHTPSTQRSQSLFQRITGFGLVRPSSADKEEDENQPEALEATTNQPRMTVESSDRPAASNEPADLLDIPAFLRRQTNH